MLASILPAISLDSGIQVQAHYMPTFTGTQLTTSNIMDYLSNSDQAIKQLELRWVLEVMDTMVSVQYHITAISGIQPIKSVTPTTMSCIFEQLEPIAILSYIYPATPLSSNRLYATQDHSTSAEPTIRSSPSVISS